MARRKWFAVWAQGPAHEQAVELARVVSAGLAQLIAFHLREHGYQNVTIR